MNHNDSFSGDLARVICQDNWDFNAGESIRTPTLLSDRRIASYIFHASSGPIVPMNFFI